MLSLTVLRQRLFFNCGYILQHRSLLPVASIPLSRPKIGQMALDNALQSFHKRHEKIKHLQFILLACTITKVGIGCYGVVKKC